MLRTLLQGAQAKEALREKSPEKGCARGPPAESAREKSSLSTRLRALRFQWEQLRSQLREKGRSLGTWLQLRLS